MEIFNRLGQWSEIQKVRPVEEPPEVAAGRDGELVLRELVGSSYRLEDASVFAGRRIPSRRQAHRREIDLIVCTPRAIHLIEAKNWSGRLEVVDGDWRQTRRNGEVVRHGDLLADQRLKRDAVVEYLNDRGLDLDEQLVRDHIAPKVIFTNRNLELDPAVEALPDVISRRELDGYLGRQPAAEEPRRADGLVADRVLPRLGAEGGRPSAAIGFGSHPGGSIREDRRVPRGGRDVGPAGIPRDPGRHGGYRESEARPDDVPQAGAGADGRSPADAPPVDEGAGLGPAQGRDRARGARHASTSARPASGSRPGTR